MKQSVILLPSLKRARQRAHAAVCVSNLRQLYQLVVFYAGDNRDLLPMMDYPMTSGDPVGTGVYWHWVLLPYVYKTAIPPVTHWYYGLGEPKKEFRLFVCPGDNTPIFDTAVVDGATGPGVYRQAKRSYAASFTVFRGQFWVTNGVVPLLRLSGIPENRSTGNWFLNGSPAQYFVLSDQWHTYSIFNNWFYEHWLTYPQPVYQGEVVQAFDVHVGGANWLFADGHVELMSLSTVHGRPQMVHDTWTWPW